MISTANVAVEVGFRLALWIIMRALDNISPFIRHIEEEELWMYRFPEMPNIVPKIALYLILIIIPSLVYLIQYLLTKGDKSTWQTLLNQLDGITLAYCINGIFTNLLKILVGRPRPTFFTVCFPDGYGDNVNGECTGDYAHQMQGRKSFPSAHSSMAFTGMVFVTLHIFHVLDFRKHFLGRGVVFVLALLPIVIASAIGISRTCDYHHHYSDVIGGSIIGTIIAITVFFLYSKIDEEIDAKT